MKKVIAVLTTIMMAFSLCACGGEEDLSLSNVQDSGVLKVGLTQTDSIYTSYDKDTQKYVGLEPEMIELFAGAMGAKTEYTEISMEEVSEALQNGTIDVAIGYIPYSASLEESYGVSPVYASGYVYAVTARGVYADTFGALSGANIGVAKNLSYESRGPLNASQNATVTEYTDLNEVKNAITNGSCDIYFCYEKQAEELIADSSFQVQNMIGADLEHYVILTAPTSYELQSVISSLVVQYLDLQQKEATADGEESTEGGEEQETSETEE